MHKKLYLLPAIVLLLTAACTNQKPKFHIVGNISEAKDSMLYLEHLTLNQGCVAIDSVKLDNDGDFDLKGDTIHNPEFYRLRLGRQIIPLSIDSTETVTVTATAKDFATDYKIEGSGNCDTIRLINKELQQLMKEIDRVANDRSMTLEDRDSRIGEMIAQYKHHIKIDYVQNHYGSAASYYAMFQSLRGQYIFDPISDSSDVTWFTALATAWMEQYPGQQRTQNLYNIVLQGRRNTRKRTVEINLDDDKVKETGIIDMGFPDIQGKERRLSELKGNVVILDFTAYSLQNSQERILALRELYNKYHTQGLEIYQVSLDENEHYWKTMSAQLPWITVWDSEGLDNDIVRIYNLQMLPTWFLIDRENNLAGRQELMGNLESEIKKLL